MSGFSWVTLATNDSYSLGALVLAHSLKRVGTAHQLVVMVTPGVTQPMREKLRSVFDLVFEVNILDSKDERNLLLLQRPELGITFTKLHCWRLTQYAKCVFLDADTLVLQNCDELFDRDEFSAAPDVGWPDCFNSGVFVYKPSDETFNSLLTFALERGSFDGGDQGLLNLYFSDWAHKDISKHLPFIYNMCSTACYSYLPAFKQFGENVKIVHFIGNSKPWLQYFNSETLQVSCNPGFEHLQLVFEHWWNLFCNFVHSGLQANMARINTTIASSCTSSSHTLTYHINESKCENSLNTEQFYGTDVNDIPVWDPWENYQPVDNSVENMTAIDNVTNQSQFDESNSSSYYVENVLNKTESSFHESCNYNTSTQSNESFVTSIQTNQSFVTSIQSNEPFVTSIQSNCTPNNVIETDNRESHVNSGSACNVKQDEYVNDINITNDPPPNFCIYSQPQAPDQNPPSAYQSITSTVVCDAKSASTVTITTEQPATISSINEPRTDSNGGLAGAFAQMTLREPRSANQFALEDHLRRQGWEAGRIDYLGQDSFDNVWKKICETMAAAPKKEPSPPKQITPAAEPSPSPATPITTEASASTIVEAPKSESTPVTAAAIIETPKSEPVPATPVKTPEVVPSAPEPAVVSASEPAVVSAPEPAVVSAPEPAVAPAPEPVVAPAPEPAVAPAPEPAVAPASEPAVAPALEPAVVSTPEPVVAPAPEPVVAPAPEPAVVSAPAPAVVSAPEPAIVSAPEPAVAPAPELTVVPTPKPVIAPAPEPTVASVPEPVVASVPEPVVASVPEPIATPASETVPVVASTPEAVPVATPTPEVTPVVTLAPEAISVAAAAPVTEPIKEATTDTKVTEPVAAETKVVPITQTEKKKSVEKPTSSVSEGKKETVKSKAESAEGQSSESTPVPPPRKSGKNGGTTAKKTTKKK